ncbi:hypothetical protein CRM22_004566 [Opisthorchis felineus]|uniref:Anion exchange protein n=1 Tax=Opisthorchis felineus TaxID=147828 RepID=A0A4S2LVH0_OPIFE|nr:hypothetical protein CRM22_004566 [Opisthorchis felineus]TGZ67855.1 hypothetical protein CRM22_004566 [Opisthorchis felineus]TGZ67857.1 hypothetical protein CRM22_004566 [Opisthorchis felineus]
MSNLGQVKWVKSETEDDDSDSSSVTPTDGRMFFIESTAPMFIEVQELVARVYGGMQFTDEIFANPVLAHTRVLWLETARWVNFEQNYDEVEQRFNEAHVSPMKFTRLAQFTEEIKRHCVIIETDASTLGEALTELADHARASNCVTSREQYDVLRAILLSERWHPEVKGRISDSAEFEQYWNAHEIVNLGFVPDDDTIEKPVAMTSQSRGSIRPSLGAVLNLHNQPAHPYHRFNQALTDCLEAGAEACTVLCGTLNFLTKPLIALIRSKRTISNSCISEVNVPVRFIFSYLGPPSNEFKYTKLGRVFAVMMSNSIFRAAVYDAKTTSDLIKSVDLFMTDALVMPLARHPHPEALAGMVRQIEAYKREGAYGKEPERLERSTSMSKRPSQPDFPFDVGSRKFSALDIATQEGALTQMDATQRGSISATERVPTRQRCLNDFCPPYVDFARGIRPWINRFSSDFKDAVKKDNVGIVFGSVLFLYFVNLAPAITFAALLNSQVDKGFTVSVTLVSTGVYLIVFTLFAGQPLAFIGITGPMFILETSLASIAKTAGVPLMQIRFWTSIYCAICGFFFITLNASVLANQIRRSVEEVFNAFIAFFFLLKALFTMFRLIPFESPSSTDVASQLSYKTRMAIAGATLFLAFIKLQFCLILARIKGGNYFRRIIRKLLGALNVPLGMVLIAVLNQIFFLGFELPMVNIPPSNQINVSRWVNFPNYDLLNLYTGNTVGLVHGVGFAIGFTMSIIVFTEAALNGITAMKNKAVKPNVFVIDLFLLTIIFPLVSGLMGWPFVSGATVRTMSNLVALVKLDHAPAPGMPHRVIGTVEQRVSGMLVGLLVFLSVFLGSVLRFIPVAALYGMFLYMGVMGLRDLQFFRRFLALMKRRKHWEDWECVRGLPSKHILVFAVIQAVVIGILVVLNIISEFTAASYVGIVFPLVVLLYALLRELVFPKWRWLAPFLHQLDRKYKLNPAPVKPSMSVPRCISVLNKDSVASFGNTHLAMKIDEVSGQRSKEFVETDSYHEYSDHEDGVIRRTWAT